jgi:hypothetical protein
MNKTVYILGAGFSRSAQIPLQSEIIKEIFKIENDELPTNYRQLFIQYRNDFKYFLSNSMYLDEHQFGEIELEDIYTPIDRCIIDNLSFRNIPTQDLIDLRQKINGLIIILFNYKPHFVRTRGGYIEHFTDYLINLKKRNIKNDPFAILSTNWDIVLDNSFQRKISNTEGVVDYCCNSTSYDPAESLIPGLLAIGKGMYNIKLLKLHGSLNWLHCKRCQRLFVTFFEKIALEQYLNKPICRICEKNFRNKLTNDGGAQLSSQLIMPTFLKDLNNVQLKIIWQNAGIELAEASIVVFMGYSFPKADFELRQLLARNIRHDAKIEVVLKDKPTQSNYLLSAENRYRTFFGKRDIQFFYEGVDQYIHQLT